MLHQNHNYPLLSSTKLSSSFPQVEKGDMGRIVKGGLTPKMILEDVCFNNFSQPPQFHYSNFVVLDDSGDDNDDFFVDQLLNLNNNDDGINPQEIITHQFHQQQQQNMESSNSVLVNFKQQQQVDNEDKNTPFLTPPLDMAEEADLEWLSHFVDDYTNSTPEPKPELGSKLKPIELVEPTKCPEFRAKMWEKLCVGLMRKCSHCGVHKTPQWRNGPNGKRSLCNACGVRFKKGLLFPEYRPACSPTFSMELHSNLNRKVMEMRMMKECKPQEEEADLGGRSHFVDETCRPLSTPFSPGYIKPKPVPKPKLKPELMKVDDMTPLSLRRTRRRKRARTRWGVWDESESDPTLGPYSTPFLPDYFKPVDLEDTTPSSLKRAGGRKQAKIPVQKREKSDVGLVKKCSHCGVQETLLWQKGPKGSMSLCNACGVRFNQGMLLPEY